MILMDTHIWLRWLLPDDPLPQKLIDIIESAESLNLKIASVLWPNMQGIGHAAIVNYCKWPITQQIRPQGAPEGFTCF
jgi:hypothetical protein